MKNKLSLLILFGLALAIPRLTWGVTYSTDQTLASLTENVLLELDGANDNDLITITSEALEDFDISFNTATTVNADGTTTTTTSALQDILFAPTSTNADVTIAGSIGANGEVGDITNTGTGARTFKKTVTATNFTGLNAAGKTYTFEAALDLTTDYDGGAGDEVFESTVKIGGNLNTGFGTTTLKGETEANIVTGDASTASIVNIEDSFKGNIKLGTTSTLNLYDGSTVTGDITAVTTNTDGDIVIEDITEAGGSTVGTAGVKIVGNIGTASVLAKSFTIGDNADLKLEATEATTGAAYTAGFGINAGSSLELLSDYTIKSTAAVVANASSTIKLNNHTLDLLATEFGTLDGTTIELSLNADEDFGNIKTTSSGTGTIFAGGTIIKPTINYLIDGASKTYTIISTGKDQGSVVHEIAAGSNTALYTFAVAVANTNNHALTATRTLFTASDFDYTDNGDKVAAILEGVAEDKDSGEIQLSTGASDVGFASLAKITEDADLVAAVETLDPDVSGGVSKGTFLASTELINTVDARLSSVTSGVSSGDHHYSSALWMKAYGGNAEQEAVGGIAGYDADVFGTAIGFDTLISSNLTLGVAVGFSDTDVETSSIQNTDITSYTGIIYGKFGISNFYADAFAAYSKNSYESKRTLLTSQSALGDYDGNQYSFKLKLGYNFKLSDSLKLTPLVSVHNSSLTTDAYSESGTSGFNLDVDKKDTDMLKLGLGLEVGYALSDYLVSSFRIMSVSDSELETVKATSSFSNITGDTLTTTGATSIDKSSILAGFGLTYLGDGVSLSGNYNYETKDNYKAHSYDLLLRVDF